ncbi:unnamed protein product, partial [Didymodactylos carnosus]
MMPYRTLEDSGYYKLVREADDSEIFHLYVEITKGRNRGHFKMLTNSMECEFLLTVALEKMRDSGIITIVKDLKDAADTANLFIAREHCEFINRCVIANVAISTTTTTELYDVTKLGHGKKQKTKQKKQQAAAADRKPATTKTKKTVVSTSKCLATSAADEEDDAEAVAKPVANTTRLVPKLRLCPITVDVGTKQLGGNFQKSATSSSSDKKKRKQDD